jgi:LuxR family transcriptional regulator, maltose regulon positive regulatory protein
LDEAAVCLQQSRHLCEQWAEHDLQAAGCAAQARVELGRGNPDQARQALESAAWLAQAQPFSRHWSLPVAASLARSWLALGEVEKWTAWFPTSSGDDDVGAYRLEPVYLLQLRRALAQGEFDQALTICDQLLPAVQTGGRLGCEIELLVLTALAWEGKKERARALAMLEQALHMAGPQGYIRLFLDEGEPLARLLHHAKAQGIGGEFASNLLAAFTSPENEVPVAPGSGASPAAMGLIDPISAREQEVLQFIATGYSNTEIAERCVISEKTVKRHISNIYRKLDVKTRTQAVALGRELKLIP